MEQALRPNRSGTVLALGALSVVIPLVLVSLAYLRLPAGTLFIPSGAVVVPFGVLACVIGVKQIAGMREMRIDPAGRALARVGAILGPVGVAGWTVMTCFLLYAAAHLFSGDSTWMMESTDGTRQVTMHHGDLILNERRESRRPDGTWVKDGPSVMRKPDGSGRKIEEGSYRDGKRVGQWTFWNEDGSIDTARSGIYEDDARVQVGPTPPGDYPVRAVPPGYRSKR